MGGLGEDVRRHRAGTVAGIKFERLCLPCHSLAKNATTQDCLFIVRKMKTIKHLLIRLINC